MTDAESISHHIAQIAATADHYPGVVIVLNSSADTVLYMSERGLHLLHTTPEELAELGPGYGERYFNPDELPEYAPKLVDLMMRNEPGTMVSFFQQVRTGPEREFAWYFSTLRVLAQSIEGRPLLLICFASPVDKDTHITPKIQRLLDENKFLRTHAHTFACLSPREREVLRGMALGQAAMEMANALFISVQTVETHRRNLRRKLGVASSFELSQYARAFDLI